MIERLAGAAPTLGQGSHTGKILKMVHNPRMGGSVPVWVKADSVQDQISISMAQGINRARSDNASKNVLAYQMQEPSQTSADEEFGFYDLLDMINPLQHIPIANTLYRKLSGDEIKDVPQIIGGAIFGGVAGAAASLANVIVREETGKDIASNAYSLVTTGQMPKLKINPVAKPEQRLAEILSPPGHELPAALLAFTAQPSSYKITKAESPAKEFSAYEIY